MPTGGKPEPGAFTREIAAILRAQRARLTITQEALTEAVQTSRAVEISQSQLSRVMRGQKHIDFDLLDALCLALGLDIVDVVRQANEATRDRHRKPSRTTSNVKRGQGRSTAQPPEQDSSETRKRSE